MTGRLAKLMDADLPPSDPAPARPPTVPEGDPRPELSVEAVDDESIGGSLDDADDGGDAAPIPSVVAVVVAQGDALYLEACLGSLAASDYPDLTVLVIAETDEDLKPRVAAVLPTAFVRPVTARGIGAGANEAIATVAGAPFLLFCHSDVVVDPNAIRVLVEEAYRSNAAIVGPKIVDIERPEILREVGWSVDRFGVPHSEIERDELDQEQHDAVRDVFFVRDACMLVRADLFNELGGFDVECDPGARELDLCWRARLAAARVIVAPDARVGHHEEDGPHESDPRLAQRHRVRALLTNTSAARLLWIAPVALLMHFAEALVFLFRRRRDRASVLVGAWTWNLRKLGPLRRSRRRAQAARVVPDREIHALQFRGSARVSSYMTTSLHAEDRVRALSERGRSVAGSATTQFRSLRGLLLLGGFAIALLGTRDLIIGRLAAVGQFVPWPGAGDLLRSFTSEWRFADLGAHAPAPPLLALVAGLRVLGLGSGGFVRSLLVASAIPLGAFGAARVSRRISGRGWPGAMTAVAYGIVPIPRNAIAAGRPGPLMVYVAAPFILLALLQLGGLVPSRWPRRRIAVLGGVAVALAATFWPLAIALPVAIVLGLAVVAPITRDGGSRLAALAGSAGVMTGLGLLLLFPWPFAFIGSGDRVGALGIVFEPTRSFGSLLRLVTGPNGGGIGTWAFLVVGLAVTLVASGERGVWCVRLWGIALVAWLVALLPTWLGTASPAIEGVLVPAALALALMAGIGVATFLEEVRRGGLGWRHALSVAAAVTLGLAMLTFVGDAAGGRWHQSSDDWNSTLSWMQSQRDRGPFRVLWVGSPDVLPGAAHRSGSTAFSLTNDGPGDLRDALPPPGGAGFAAAHDAVAELRDQRTSRFGRIVGPMAVRYIAAPLRSDPGAVETVGSDDGLAAALSRQLDLRQLEVAPGMLLYENTAWIPGEAVVASAPTDRPTGGTATLVRGSAAPAGSTPARADTLVWSQQYSSDWEVRAAPNRSVTHRRVFGWANGYTPANAVSSDITFSTQWWRWPLLFIELGIIVALARRALRRGRRGRRAARRAAARSETTVSDVPAVLADASDAAPVMSEETPS